MQKLSRIWKSISLTGVDEGLDSRLSRRIVLANQLAITVAFTLFFAWIPLILTFHGSVLILIAVLLACFLNAATILFNHFRWHDFSRIWFNMIPLAMILFIAGAISDGQVVSMKIVLLSVIIVPMTLFGVEERGKMILGIAAVFLAYAGMDLVAPLIPNWIQIDPGIIDHPVSITINGLTSLALFIMAFVYFQTLTNDAEQKLMLEKERSERLLLNILPAEIAAALKDSPDTLATSYDGASVLFADIVNFTPLTAQLTSGEVVKLLNEVFSYFDTLVERYEVEKIKTIGDCYMVAAGAPRLRADHAQVLTRLALEAQEHFRTQRFGGLQISFRIGINSGPLVAGVIGRRKFSYDLWGDTVNTASRMEAHGTEGCTQITSSTYELIKDQFVCEPRGLAMIKGKGEMQVWHVIGPVRSSDA